MASGISAEELIRKLQKAIEKVIIWLQKWRLKLNEFKASYSNFTNRKINPTQTIINVHYYCAPENTVKYLVMTLDAKIQKEHVKKKIAILN